VTTENPYPTSDLEALPFEPRRIDKPWGYELIWALADDL
jgi:hypothetical protein